MHLRALFLVFWLILASFASFSANALGPSKVTGVSATKGTLYGKVTVSWNKNDTAVGYHVYRSTVSGSLGSYIANVTTGISYDDTAIFLGQHYFYTIVSYDLLFEGPNSAQVEGWGKMPAAIADLTATQNTIIGKVSLSWTPNVDATGYEIWRSDTAAGTSARLSTIGAASSFDDTTVVGTSHYFYTVKVKVGSLVSPASNQAEGWGKKPYPLQVTGVTATQGTLYGKSSLIWSVATDAESYRVYRSTAAGTKGAQIATGITDTTYDDPTVSGTIHYFYTIVATNTTGDAPDSAQAEGWGKMPAGITDLSATQNTNIGKVALSWTPNADATGYEIWRADTAVGAPALLSTVGAVSSFDDTTVVGSTHYFYTVKVKVGSLVSPASNQAEGWGKKPYPLQVTGVSASQGTIYGKSSIAWSMATDAESYSIYRSDTAGVKGSQIATGLAGTDYEDSTVSEATHYFYTVVATNTTGDAPDSAQVEGWGKMPAAIGNLIASKGTVDGKVSLSWTSAQDATGYEIWRAASSGGAATLIETLTSPVSSYEDTTVTTSNPYFYTVKVKVGSLIGAASNKAEGWRKLPMVSTLAATKGELTGKVHLDWNIDSEATKYEVWRSNTSGVEGTKIATLTGNSFEDSTTGANTHYFYTIKIVVGALIGDIGNEAEGWGKLPATIDSLTATQGTLDGKVRLTWELDPEANEYEVYRATNAGGARQLIGTTVTNFYDDVTVPTSFQYYYTVKAKVDSLTALDSNESSGWRKLPIISTLSATQGTIEGKVSLNWTPDTEATGYEIYRSVISGGPYSLLATVMTSSFEDDTIANNKRYFYTVKVKVGAISGDVGNEASGWRKLPFVSSLFATQGNLTGKVSLTWAQDPSATAYEIWRSPTADGSAATLLATQSETTYEDTAVDGLTVFYYTVKIKVEDLVGAASNTVPGWANLPPSSASATITTTWPTISAATVPDVIDPNIAAGQDDSITLAITEQPVKGEVTIENGKFVYTPKQGVGYFGDLSFQFTATDKAGESVVGIGAIHVLKGCFEPTVSNMTVADKLLPQMHPNFTFTYDANACNGNMSGSIKVSKSGVEVENDSFALTDYGNSVSFTLPGNGLDTGDYVVDLTITTEIGTVSKSLAFKVNDVLLPTLIFTPKIVEQAKSKTTISIYPNDKICSLTANQSIAESDSRKCFVTLNGTVPGLSVAFDAQNIPMLTGYPSDAGEFPVTVNTSRWVDGIRYDLQPVTGSLTVTQAPLPNFSLTGDGDVIQSIEKLQLRFKQTEGDYCSVFSDLDKAKATSVSLGRKVCFISFDIPAGITVSQGIEQINLEGFLSEIGSKQINYNVSFVYPDGSVSQIPVGGSMALNVSALSPPIVEMKGGMAISSDRYYVPIGQPVTRIKFSAGFSTYSRMNLIIDDGIQTQYRNDLVNEGYIWIKTPNLKLMEQRSIRIRLSWADYPGIFTEKTITAIGGAKNTIKLLIDSQRKVSDTEEVIVKLRLGEYLADGSFVYDPETMGQWRTHLLMTANTQSKTVPTTQVVDMVNGEAEYRFTLSGYLFMKVTAVAQLVTDIPDLNIPIKSQTRFIEVLNGSPLQGTITSKGLDGPAPKIFSLTLDQTPDNRGALKEVSWEESVDDGATWKTIENADQVKTNVALLEPGRKKIRAKMVNKNNLIESYTDPVELWAYSKLEGTVIGPNFTSPNAPATLAAELYQDGVKVDDAVIEWTIDYGEGVIATETGPTVAVSDTKQGKANVIMKARPGDTRPDDRYAWSYTRHYVLIRDPSAPAVQAYGPKEVETGKTYHYTGKAKPSWGTLESVQKLSSEWQLPDGSTVSGDELDWTPTADVATDPKPIIYRAWVSGFKDSTAKEIFVSYKAWEYVWPNWSISFRQSTAEAPSDLTFMVEQDRSDMGRRFEGLTYDWSFPVNVNGKQNGSFPNKANAQVVYEGTYTISVKVRDARGNQTTLTQDVTAIAAAPYVATIKVSKSNAYDRAPMSVTVRPTVAGGHPLDAIDKQTWSIDGTIINEYTNRSFLYTTIPEAGDHVIHYEMKSKMGRIASVDSPLPLAQNKNPECGLAQTNGSLAVYIEAKCTDSDGKVSAFSWSVNGSKISSTSYRIGFNKGTSPQAANVTFVGTDDAGGNSEPVNLVVNY